MPRPRNSLLHDMFTKNTSNDLICNNGDCFEKVLNMHSANLERHLRTFHPKLYAKYIVKKNNLNAEYDKIIKIRLSKEVNKRNIGLAIVELFTKNGRPLNMAEDRAFKVLVQPVFDVLHINVNEHSITEHIGSFYSKLKAEIVGELKGKLISLKIDAATSENVSLLGINVQYVKDKTITIKTLAIRELRLSHTSEELKSIVMEVLQDYSIDVKQILTITTDNGGTMSRVDRNNDFLQNSLNDEVLDNHRVESLEAIRGFFDSWKVSSVRSGANTLQLCALDVLEREEIKQKLDKCRAVVKELISLTNSNALKDFHYKKPVIDCRIRWISTFEMLERLLEIREILDLLSSENKEFKDLHLTTRLWTFVGEFLKTFRALYNASLKLESEQMCFSELYAILMDVIIQTENAPPCEMTIPLKAALNKRKSKLLENEFLNASIFCDPRLRICLDLEQTLRAEGCITSLHQRIKGLKDSTDDAPQQSIKMEVSDEPTTSEVATPKSFLDYLQRLDPAPVEGSSKSTSAACLETDIFMYKRQNRYPIDSNILDFWGSQTSSLSTVANVLLAIPSTQVGIERLFSALKYILSDQENRFLFALEEILLVKANGEFSYDD